MLGLVLFLFILQLVLLTMSVFNLSLVILGIFTGADQQKLVKLSALVFIYGLSSLISGGVATALLP